MKYSTFHKAVKSSKNQLLIITEDEKFYVHLHKISYNEVGVVCTSEKTGKIKLVFYEEISNIISDGKVII